MKAHLLEFTGPAEFYEHSVIAQDAVLGINLRQFVANINTVLKVLSPDILFYPSYPETVQFYEEYADRFQDTITWDVKHMSPQQLGGKSSPNAASGTRDVRSKYRRTVKNEETGEEYQIYGQLFQAYIQFDIWAKTAKEVEDITYWFQNDFMAHFGNSLGSQEVRFYERIRDRELLKINNRLQNRSLIYYVLLEETTVKSVDLITRIKAKINK